VRAIRKVCEKGRLDCVERALGGEIPAEVQAMRKACSVTPGSAWVVMKLALLAA
jgi:hypothetical protein